MQREQRLPLNSEISSGHVSSPPKISKLIVALVLGLKNPSKRVEEGMNTMSRKSHIYNKHLHTHSRAHVCGHYKCIHVHTDIHLHTFNKISINNITGITDIRALKNMTQLKQAIM